MKVLGSMRGVIVIAACWSLLGGRTDAQTLRELLGQVVGESQPSEEPAVADGGEAGLALMEALVVSSDQAVARASRPDGFLGDPTIRVALPEGLAKARATLQMFGADEELAAFEVSLNRAAESASSEAFPLLRDAVREVVFDDPVAVLRAGGSAATETLRAQAAAGLADALEPHVRAAIERAGVVRSFDRLAKAGGRVVTLTGVKAADLTPHVTGETLDGLFTLIAAGEVAIRTDRAARTTPLLVEVFGSAEGTADRGPDEQPPAAPATAAGDTDRALEEALIVAAQRAVQKASQLDGYFGNATIRIPLPRSVRTVGDSLRRIGMGGMVDDFELAMNRGAERAAAEATPILVDAVKGTSFDDAIAILRGGETAATDTLRAKTEARLSEVFRPIIAAKLDEVGATRSYDRLMEQSGGLMDLLGGGAKEDLPSYVTGKALDGLFVLVAEEEKRIRDNPVARSTELLKRVFGSLR